MAGSNQSSTAHSAAVNAITDARQTTRKYVYLMEASEDVQWDAIFVDPNTSDHPQKMAHAALMDFHQQVAQSEYTAKVQKLWSENLQTEKGNDLKISVPKHDTVAKTVTEKTGVSNIVPDRSAIETKEETVSLETLQYRWSGRSITVEVDVDSPYRNAETEYHTLRLWLPPKAIVAAYGRLNDALSKLNLLAKTQAPVEHDPDPI